MTSTGSNPTYSRDSVPLTPNEEKDPTIFFKKNKNRSHVICIQGLFVEKNCMSIM